MKKFFYFLLAICFISNCGKKITDNCSNEITVYVGGYKHEGKRSQAIYWKNGKEVVLTNGEHSVSVESLYIYDRDIYAAIDDKDFKAKYWKNGEFIYLQADNEKSLAL